MRTDMPYTDAPYSSSTWGDVPKQLTWSINGFPYTSKRKKTIKKPRTKPRYEFDISKGWKYLNVPNADWEQERLPEKIDDDTNIQIGSVIVEVKENEDDKLLYEIVKIDGKKFRVAVRCENCNAKIGKEENRTGESCPYCGI